MPGLRTAVATVIVFAGCARQAGPGAGPQWLLDPVLEAQSSGADALFISVSIVDRDTVWISGTGGTFARTTNGGVTWKRGTVPGADSLQFRDVHALNGSVAWLLSIGNGEQSRIYHTTDGGATWSLQFTNREPDGFFDCFDFWDDRTGIAFSDSFDGAFYIIRTTDGGETWARVPAEALPSAEPGEGSFASSGTCLVTGNDGAAWIGTGASPAGARVLRTTDRGETWSVASTPVTAGSAAGIATLAFHDDNLGSALGGDIASPDSVTPNVAITADAGLTWSSATPTPFAGAAYGSAWVPGAPDPTLVAVGPGGVAFTNDRARSWTTLDSLNHWSVAFAAPDAGWAVGPAGRITRIRLFRRQN